MSELKRYAQILKEKLSGSDITKYSYELSESEKTEFNLENGEFSLMRTVFGKSAGLSVFKGKKKGSSRGNDLTEEGLAVLTEEASLSADSSVDDDCNDIAGCEGECSFKNGNGKPDMGTLFNRTKELLSEIRERYPKVLVMSAITSCDKTHTLYENSNGTSFTSDDINYSLMLEFAGNDGQNTTGIFGSYVSFKDPDVRLIELSEIDRDLKRAEDSLNTVSLADKFEGTVVFTPSCAMMFVYMTLENYISSGVVMDGTSLWKDRLGQKVASDMLSVALDPEDSRLAEREFWTPDGFKSEKVSVIDKGVLSSFMLSLYASKKTGNAVTKNEGGNIIIAGGDRSAEDIIASVERGLLVGGFSGGQPGANGEFSGVAKNSFYIENGKIKGAVTETMINGNLGDVLNNIVAVSREQVCDGTMAAPYIAAKGIIISGK